MKLKSAEAKVKAVATDAKNETLSDGQFVALVSVFGNVDSYGDVVMPGAFTKSLSAWASSGDTIPVIWSHNWADAFSHIGHVVKAEETAEGLLITGELDLENPTAKQVYKLLKARRIKEFSFGYDILEAAHVEKDGESYYELRELSIIEVGPCLKGVNPETELLAVKAQAIEAGVKAGRVLSAANQEKLTAAKEALESILAAVAEAEKDSASALEEETPLSSEGEEKSHAAEENLKSAAPLRATFAARIAQL